MPDFGIFRGFNENLFGDKLYAGQLPVNLGMVGKEFVFFLDLFQNAAVAFSLRKLRPSYTGSVIRVRRSSDNAELDIGFVENVLDTASLTAFCGLGNGFVKTWYDQSYNVYNATQTTLENQPQIVSSGNVILENGKPAILGLGSNTSMQIPFPVITPSTSQNFGIYFIATPKNLTTNLRIVFSQYTTSSTGRLIAYASLSEFRSAVQIGSSGTNIASPGSTETACFYYARYGGINLITGYNSTTSPIVTTTNAIPNTNAYLFNAIGSGGGCDDALQEIIVYDFDTNSNRSLIQLEQANYYGINL
jgi:hypothetical protein